MAKTKRKRRKTNKGTPYEREMSRKLSLWWSGGERDDLFWRTQGSGARHTTRKKAGKDTHGQAADIGATHPLGESLTSRCVIEIKRGYNDSTLHDLLDSPGKARGKIAGWIRKVADQAVDLGLEEENWMIVHRRDRRQAMVYCSHDFKFWSDLEGIRFTADGLIFYAAPLAKLLECDPGGMRLLADTDES